MLLSQMKLNAVQSALFPFYFASVLCMFPSVPVTQLLPSKLYMTFLGLKHRKMMSHDGAFTFEDSVVDDRHFTLTCWPTQQQLLCNSEDAALILMLKQKHFFETLNSVQSNVPLKISSWPFLKMLVFVAIDFKEGVMNGRATFHKAIQD